MRRALFTIAGCLLMPAMVLAQATDRTASTTFTAAAQAQAISMAGMQSVSVTLPSINTLVATLVAEYASTDNPTDTTVVWQSTSLRAPGGSWTPSISVSSTSNTYNILPPGGASYVRVRVSAYTSGAATVILRATAQAEAVQPTAPVTTTAFAYESLTFGATAIGFTQAIYAPAGQPPATVMVMFCRTAAAQMSFRYDGVAPTSGFGVLVNQGDAIKLVGATNISQFKGIRAGSISVVCDVHYEH